MISSASSSERASRPELIAPAGESLARPTTGNRDTLSTQQAAFLRAELERQPAVRPEVVARAQQLLADPNYPGPDVLRSVATQIISAADLSESEG